MQYLNVLNVLHVSNNDGKWNLKVYILDSYAWKSSFGIIFASIATPMKWSGIYKRMLYCNWSLWLIVVCFYGF